MTWFIRMEVKLATLQGAISVVKSKGTPPTTQQSPPVYRTGLIIRCGTGPYVQRESLIWSRTQDVHAGGLKLAPRFPVASIPVYMNVLPDAISVRPAARQCLVAEIPSCRCPISSSIRLPNLFRPNPINHPSMPHWVRHVHQIVGPKGWWKDWRKRLAATRFGCLRHKAWEDTLGTSTVIWGVVGILRGSPWNRWTTTTPEVHRP